MTNTFQEWIDYSKYGGLDFNRLRSGPFEGPAIVIPPALPEDTYASGELEHGTDGLEITI